MGCMGVQATRHKGVHPCAGSVLHVNLNQGNSLHGSTSLFESRGKVMSESGRVLKSSFRGSLVEFDVISMDITPAIAKAFVSFWSSMRPDGEANRREQVLATMLILKGVPVASADAINLTAALNVLHDQKKLPLYGVSYSTAMGLWYDGTVHWPNSTGLPMSRTRVLIASPDKVVRCGHIDRRDLTEALSARVVSAVSLQ